MEMTQVEKDAVQLMVNDPVLFPALMKVVEKAMYEEKNKQITQIFLNLSQMNNEMAGGRLRALREGNHLVSSIFSNLLAYKELAEHRDKVHPGR